MTFNFDTPYTSSRLPLFARNVVSTSHPLAAQAGKALDALAFALAIGFSVGQPQRHGVALRQRHAQRVPLPVLHGLALGLLYGQRQRGAAHALAARRRHAQLVGLPQRERLPERQRQCAP